MCAIVILVMKEEIVNFQISILQQLLGCSQMRFRFSQPNARFLLVATMVNVTLQIQQRDICVSATLRGQALIANALTIAITLPVLIMASVLLDTPISFVCVKRTILENSATLLIIAKMRRACFRAFAGRK